MGINWLVAKGKIRHSKADLDIVYSKSSCPQFRFYFSRGAYATKLKNAERILIGMNKDETRLYFSPANSRMGYKVVNQPSKGSVTVSVAASKVAEAYPTVSPSALIGTYELKYDLAENLNYISIGALPR